LELIEKKKKGVLCASVVLGRIKGEKENKTKNNEGVVSVLDCI
jgi:hypothetical protein